MSAPHLSARFSAPRLSRRAFLRAAAAVSASAALAGCAGWPVLHADADPILPDTTPAPEDTADSTRAEYRAIWISYIEWQRVDFSSESAFTAAVETMLDNCVSLGVNTVLAQVRPFGDALYRSTLYPWSHLCTGTQGEYPGFDPLDILLRAAHARGLSLEAWLNPYRLRLSATLPAALAETNLANTHPDWVAAVGDGLYLNPAIPEAAAYVVQGVEELVQNYAVDGIHFDDYFYPTTDVSLDEAQFAASGQSDLATWRRANVSALVKAVHDVVKAADPTLRFGVSPQGNPDNDRTQQYSDVSAWLVAEGEDACVDYLCPQIYWGYHYMLSSGSQRFAFENITAEWCAMPRAADVALYFGLGAWRIGDGDGGTNDDSVSQWQSGSNLAQQVADLRARDVNGWALYRYGSLFDSAWPDLAAAECAALAAANA
jgi:uncharacterized lipoprotein YddW (UPF0748 family)